MVVANLVWYRLVRYVYGTFREISWEGRIIYSCLFVDIDKVFLEWTVENFIYNFHYIKVGCVVNVLGYSFVLWVFNSFCISFCITFCIILYSVLIVSVLCYYSVLCIIW